MPDARRGLPRVTLVDDDVRLLETWRDILAPSFEVRHYDDPNEAMRAFEREPVDVALLDVQLPGKNGLELLAHLRRVQPRAQAIMITGNATVEMAVTALHAGAFDFLCKPNGHPAHNFHRGSSAAERESDKDADDVNGGSKRLAQNAV